MDNWLVSWMCYCFVPNENTLDGIRNVALSAKENISLA